jgi:hypothetical protein
MASAKGSLLSSLEERKDEADELAEILREFNKYADILIKEWGKRYIG